MNIHPKFTVIIPTRERADVLSGSLKTALMQEYDNLEILVSDNFSSDHTREVVASFHDPRIRYINTGKRLSMSHNWEFALSHVDSGWLTMLGDDDGLLPGSIQRVVDIAREHRVEAVRSDIGAFLWPSITQTGHGRLSLSLRRGGELRQAQTWLTKVMEGWASSATLPMLYTGGFVSSELVQRARHANGIFYHSMIPDVYSAIAFARLLKHYYYSHEPLAVGGASAHSNGASAFKAKREAKEMGTDSPMLKFLSEANIPFHSDLPSTADGAHLRSNQAIVYESYLQSAHLSPHLPLESDPLADRRRQLGIILRTAKSYLREETQRWAESFAQQHGFSLAGIGQGRFTALSPARSLSKHTERMAKKYRTVHIHGETKLPLKDIHEACIVAAALKRLRHSS